MFPIHFIDRLHAEGIEYLGTKRKFWFTLNDTRYLFKAEERGTREDWAEKIVCELSRRIGLPHVEYELAHEFEDTQPIQPDVICPITKEFTQKLLEINRQKLLQGLSR